jgi:hypothetical protein
MSIISLRFEKEKEKETASVSNDIFNPPSPLSTITFLTKRERENKEGFYKNYFQLFCQDINLPVFFFSF